MMRPLPKNQKRATKIRRDDFVKRLCVALCDWRKRHNAGVVHDDIHMAEGFERLLEELLYSSRIGYVGLDGERVACGSQPLGDAAPYAARCSSNDCCLRHTHRLRSEW